MFNEVVYISTVVSTKSPILLQSFHSNNRAITIGDNHISDVLRH